MANSKIIPIADAITDARQLLNSGKLPTHKELATRWHCSLPRVSYVLAKVKTSNKKTLHKPVRRSVTISATSTPKHPLLSRIHASLLRTEDDLVNAEGYISAIPGLGNSEIKKLVKKIQAGVWAEFHRSVSKELPSIEKLAKGKRKRRSTKK
ncbi:MAG TPA: hypothetical protein VFA55_09780 [Candidatus Kapabacteria bacterium]|nr:hypothetical protein [Candidatus Kapabacteria bacterium]